MGDWSGIYLKHDLGAERVGRRARASPASRSAWRSRGWPATGSTRRLGAPAGCCRPAWALVTVALGGRAADRRAGASRWSGFALIGIGIANAVPLLFSAAGRVPPAGPVARRRVHRRLHRLHRRPAADRRARRRDLAARRARRPVRLRPGRDAARRRAPPTPRRPAAARRREPPPHEVRRRPVRPRRRARRQRRRGRAHLARVGRLARASIPTRSAARRTACRACRSSSASRPSSTPPRRSSGSTSVHAQTGGVALPGAAELLASSRRWRS